MIDRTQQPAKMSVEHVLSYARANAEIARFSSRLLARVPENTAPWPEAKLAAVAAILRVVDGPELLFIKRAIAAHDPWSGHIAFPGGRRELHDASLEDTAVRETREEIDLDISGGHLLGRLDDLAPRTKVLPPIIIRPFVAIVAPDVVFTPSFEVAETFWVPLAWLRSPESRSEHAVSMGGSTTRFPGYNVNGHIVWGLTERIVTQMLTLFDA